MYTLGFWENIYSGLGGGGGLGERIHIFRRNVKALWVYQTVINFFLGQPAATSRL